MYICICTHIYIYASIHVYSLPQLLQPRGVEGHRLDALGGRVRRDRGGPLHSPVGRLGEEERLMK